MRRDGVDLLREGGVVEYEYDCLHISRNENQTAGVVLRKNSVMCSTSLTILEE